MKAITKFPVHLFLLFLTSILMGCEQSDKSSENGNSKNIVVLVKYKAQPDKATEAVSELTQLIEQVKNEPHFLKIKLHVDPKDNTNILLYEEWGDASYYNTEHMNTAHLQEFIANSRNFLAGPPEISLWSVQSIFN